MIETLIPQVWQDMLHRLHILGFPEAVIAGGALRDLDNGREIKDVDIFVQDQPGVKAKLDAVFGTQGVSLVPEFVLAYCEFNEEVIDVFDYGTDAVDFDTLLSPPPYQVIVLSSLYDPFQAMERFDLGITQIAFDGTRMFVHPNYTRDKEQKRMTLVRCESSNDWERTERRWKRHSKKYEHWAFVTPAEYAAYVPVDKAMVPA